MAVEGTHEACTHIYICICVALRSRTVPSSLHLLMNTVSNNEQNNVTECMLYMPKVAKLLALFHTCGDTTTRVMVSLVASLTANHLVSLLKPTLAEDSHCLIASLASVHIKRFVFLSGMLHLLQNQA